MKVADGVRVSVGSLVKVNVGDGTRVRVGVTVGLSVAVGVKGSGGVRVGINLVFVGLRARGSIVGRGGLAEAQEVMRNDMTMKL